MARFFPFMLLAVVAYGVAVAAMGVPLSQELLNLRLPSGSVFTLTMSELLLAISTVVLFFEIMNATSANTPTANPAGQGLVKENAAGKNVGKE